jgi:hypothetical protein
LSLNSAFANLISQLLNQLRVVKLTVAGSFTLSKALPLSKSATKQDIWRQTVKVELLDREASRKQTVKVELLDPEASRRQTSYYTSKQNTVDNLELAQLKLEQISTLSLTLNQQILIELDNSTRELLKNCSIDACFWPQNSFIRIDCDNSQLFSYLKRHRKWLFYLHQVVHKLVAEIKKIEVIYQEGDKIDIFYRTLD